MGLDLNLSVKVFNGDFLPFLFLLFATKFALDEGLSRDSLVKEGACKVYKVVGFEILDESGFEIMVEFIPSALIFDVVGLFSAGSSGFTYGLLAICFRTFGHILCCS
jgi:hypothetical protein